MSPKMLLAVVYDYCLPVFSVRESGVLSTFGLRSEKKLRSALSFLGWVWEVRDSGIEFSFEAVWLIRVFRLGLDRHRLPDPCERTDEDLTWPFLDSFTVGLLSKAMADLKRWPLEVRDFGTDRVLFIFISSKSPEIFRSLEGIFALSL